MGGDRGDEPARHLQLEDDVDDGAVEMVSWRPSSAVTEELILSVASELEARARDANAVALSLRLAAHVAPSDKVGEDPEYDARVGELLLRAHAILAGDGDVASPSVPRPPRTPTNAAVPSSAPSSPPEGARRTLPFGPESSPPPPPRMSSGPPPNTSGVRARKDIPPSPSSSRQGSNETTPKGFATQELNRWYETLTKLTADD